MPNPVSFRSDGHGITITSYAAAHFGKSLWWNGSELFLAFYLTEYLHLTGLTAGFTIAGGLVAGAGFDLAVARRRHWFASVPRAGRMQVYGAVGSIVALALLVMAAVSTGMVRVFAVVVANALYRLSYVFYDLPQNCLLSLIAWSPDRQRQAAAARTAAGAMALILMSAFIDYPGATLVPSVQSLAGVAGIAAMALVTAMWLWRETRKIVDTRGETEPHRETPLGPLLALMALVCLTIPAFSKLAPYVATYSRDARSIPLLLTIALCTAASQPLWLWAIRRRGEWVCAWLSGAILVAAAVGALTAPLTVAAALIGIGSGGLGTAIWAGFAATVSNADPLRAAPAYARLTATAKLALAMAAIGLGAILGSSDYQRDGAALLPAMIVLTMTGGGAVMLLSGHVLMRERRAETA